jgi:hypothetical protein
MANPSLGSRPGVLGTTGGDDPSFANQRELFYKIFSGEILKTYEAECVTLNRHRKRTIQYGKSAGFATIGLSKNAAYHNPGDELTGPAAADRTAFNERVIAVDNALLAHDWIANFDEAMNHFDVRGPIARNLGGNLAWLDDQRVFSALVRCARTAGQHLGRSGTVRETSGRSGAANPANAGQEASVGDVNLRKAAFNTDAQTLLNGIIYARQTFMERNVPRAMKLYCALRPAQYFLLLQLPSASGPGPLAVNKDWAAGNGTIREVGINQIADIELLMSNNIPSDDRVSADYGAVKSGGESYAGNFTSTTGIVWGEDAVATVQLRDMQVESEYVTQNQATLMVSKFIKGTGVLNPVCAAELWGSDSYTTLAKLTPA